MTEFGEGNGTPLQYSCLENAMGGGAWWAAVHGVARSWTRLSDFSFTFHFPSLQWKVKPCSAVGPRVSAAVLHAELWAHLERSGPFGIYCTFTLNLPVSLEIKNSLCKELRLFFVAWLFLRFSSLTATWDFCLFVCFFFFFQARPLKINWILLVHPPKFLRRKE